MKRTLGRPTFWVAAFLLLFWPHLIAARLYDPDEMEHLHAGYCVANGMVPYKDFFEHHGPLTYHLLALSFGWVKSPIDVLTVHRTFAFLVTILGIFFIVFGFKTAPTRQSWWGIAWLLTFPWFVEKGIEGRPDVPAAWLMLFAVWATVRGGVTGNFWFAFAAGFSWATAALFTQKVAFLGLGMIVGGIATCVAHRRNSWRMLASGLLGFLIPWVSAGCWYASQGALFAFWERVFVTPVTWPAHVPRSDESLIARLTNPTKWSPGHLAIAVLSLLVGCWRLLSRRPIKAGEAVPVFACLAHLAGLAFTPAAYLQYYLLALPTVAVVVARSLPVVFRRKPLYLAGVCIVVYFVTRVSETDRSFGPYSVLDRISLFLVGIGVACTAVAFFWNRFQKLAVVVVVVATVAAGIGRIAIQHLFWNIAHRQRADIVEFNKMTDGPVLDGFSGLGCVKPHACYWWWINHHSIPLIRKEGDAQGILEIVRRKIPHVVIYDEDLQKFGGGLMNLLEIGYEPRVFRGRTIFVRRD